MIGRTCLIMVRRMQSSALLGPLLVALSIALGSSAKLVSAQSAGAPPPAITSDEVRACESTAHTRWRTRSIREGQWRVRARVDRRVPDHIALELLLAVRDGRLLDPKSLRESTADGSASWRAELATARRNADVAAINACMVPEGRAPRFRVILGGPLSEVGSFLYLELDGGVKLLAHSWFIV